MAGNEAAASDRTDRGADDDIGHDAVRHEHAKNADMGESARGAAAKCETDTRLRRRLLLGCRFDGAVSVSRPPDQALQHAHLLNAMIGPRVRTYKYVMAIW
jgi:hypothetical protein